MFRDEEPKLRNFLHNLQIKTRPNAGSGLWLVLLLPVALIMSSAKYSLTSSHTYKLSAVFSFGFVLTSALMIYCGIRQTKVEIYNIWLIISTIVTSLLFCFCLHRGVSFSLFSGFFSTMMYNKIFWTSLERLPKCFTFGEAAVCSQGATLLLFYTLVTYYQSALKYPISDGEIATTVIQSGILGIYIIASIELKFKFVNACNFLAITLIVMLFSILLPLHVLLGRSPLFWIVNIILEDFRMYKIVPYWGVCSIFAIFVLCRQTSRAKKASTSTRKIFHILAVAVFLPGLIYNCSFMYLASGVVMGIFLFIEIIRVGKVHPFHQSLENGFAVFCDEKDLGSVALTPIYLLVGFSLPLWVHPSPCDVTNSGVLNLLPLLSGILSIGIGDSAASMVGSKFGRFRWSRSTKTIEGTVACIMSQAFVIYALVYMGFIKLSAFDLLKTVCAITVASIVEGKTDQVDNLVLPLIMYIILH